MIRKRVNCANCGMIYDIIESDSGEFRQPIACCPNCGSNAYDTIKDLTEKWTKKN